MDELVRADQDSDRVLKILEENFDPLCRCYPDGSAFVMLLDLLDSWPHLALTVYVFTILIRFE